MYNPAIHHRRSIRLQGYDYSAPGLYFLTLCIQGRACLFGDIINGEIHLNDAGRMIEAWYLKLEEKFPDIRCGEHIVMPNHFHCINQNVGANVGANPCLRPDSYVRPAPEKESSDEHTEDNPTLGKNVVLHPSTNITKEGGHMGLDQSANINQQGGHMGPPLRPTIPAMPGEHMGSPLRHITQWFKTMTTNEYIRQVKKNTWLPFDGKLWQRNYWEHIIRNEKSHRQIADYIVNNPGSWDTDIINPANDQSAPKKGIQF